MKTVLVKDGIVQNVAVSGDDDWYTYAKKTFDEVIDVEDGVAVAPGFLRTKDGFDYGELPALDKGFIIQKDGITIEGTVKGAKAQDLDKIVSDIEKAIPPTKPVDAGTTDTQPVQPK